MKNTTRRLLSALLMASMSVAMVSGCGASAPAAETKEEPAAVETPTEDPAEAPAEEPASADVGPVLARIQESGELVLGTASGYSPYEFIDITSPTQDVIGVDMALGQRIADELGVKLVVTDMTFTALLGALTTDQIDLALAGMSPTDERKKTIDFTDVYLPAEQCIVVRSEDAAKFTDLDSFTGVNVAAQKGTTQEAIAQNNMPGATVNGLEKVPVCILELTTGKSDAVVLEDTVAQQYLIANPELVICDAKFPEEVLYKDTALGVAKGNEDFLEILNGVIADCMAEGQIDAWIAEYSEIAVSTIES